LDRPTKATRAGQAFLALRGEANSAGRATAEYLRLYALEGFLLRLAASPHRDRFVLKGGVLLAAYDLRRPTADVDLAALATPNEVGPVRNLVAAIAATPLPADSDDGQDGGLIPPPNGWMPCSRNIPGPSRSVASGCGGRASPGVRPAQSARIGSRREEARGSVMPRPQAPPSTSATTIIGLDNVNVAAWSPQSAAHPENAPRPADINDYLGFPAPRHYQINSLEAFRPSHDSISSTASQCLLLRASSSAEMPLFIRPGSAPLEIRRAVTSTCKLLP
jgi:hypothetical protein